MRVVSNVTPRWRRLAIVSAALAAFLRCGGGSSSPTLPEAASSPLPSGLPAGTSISVASGEDGRPVVAAKVSVNGRQYDSDASGQVSLADTAPWGTVVDVVSPGFLDRQTLVRQDSGTRFVLWPLLPAIGFDDAYTSELVYTAGSRNPPPTGSTPLRRIRPGTTQAFVLVTQEIWGDETIREAHELAVGALTAASQGRIVYSVGVTRPGSGVVFEAKIDPAEASCGASTRAFTQLSLAGNDIVGGRIVYCLPGDVPSDTVTHELGHTFGLQHSPQWRELMAGVRQRGRAADFGPRETLAMSLLLERRSGNRFPDNDRSVAASTEAATVTILCH